MSGHGICGYAGHGMGLADSHVLYPMRLPEYGRAMLVDAHKWRAILRLGRAGSSVCLTFTQSKTYQLISQVDGDHSQPG